MQHMLPVWTVYFILGIPSYTVPYAIALSRSLLHPAFCSVSSPLLRLLVFWPSSQCAHQSRAMMGSF
jgi:hypothetical protein